ncbi:Aminomethyltransferase folate-binding domain-containing protein [Flagelloscypha sp. PMI_526]|nr:Aminomethyltransferase folate-binding domain-containing protein [Flagelloscypha sp. PMI_526]
MASRVSRPCIARLRNRALVSVTGSQATEFLNGVLSTAVQPPSAGPFFSALLHAKGRVLYDIMVYPYFPAVGKPGYILEYDSRPAESPLFETLKRFVLRSKVKIRNMTDEYSVWAQWDSSKTEQPQVKEWRPLSLRDMRAPAMGTRLLVRGGDRPPQVIPDKYLHHRILQGVPEGFDDIPHLSALPMESNLDLMGGIDFRKGCYVGQELTVRTYFKGVVRKRIVPIQLDLPKNRHIQSGAKITTIGNTEENPRALRGHGRLLSNIEGNALALLRLDHVVDNTLRFDVELPDGSVCQGIPTLPPWWPNFPSVEQNEAD